MLDIKDRYYRVLDYGFVALKDHMGSDADICEAARCSYGKGTKKTGDDTSLIRYMLRHNHTSPFEMCEVKLHMGMPIFCMRQWVRHRTANMNEYSGRYSVMPMIFYTPNREQCCAPAINNKQGSNHLEPLDEITYGGFCQGMHEVRQKAQEQYEAALTVGIARETARIDVPVSTYTYCYWKMDLNNLMHLLGLRCDSHAQWEIRQYANIIAAIFKNLYPITYQAFVDYQLEGTKFSNKEVEAIRRMLMEAGNPYPEDTAYWAQAVGITNKREIQEFVDKLTLDHEYIGVDLDTHHWDSPAIIKEMIEGNVEEGAAHD